ncbi:MAG: class II fructose-bisphosphate aldolase [Actinomycetota bacterium]|nr:class II fructose-bisphosphate aldolase [Actinomycetota bacterium]
MLSISPTSDLIDTLIDSAIEESSPIIMQVAEVHFKYLNFEEIGPAITHAADKVGIPICVHLDHGQSLQTVIRAIRAGFTSVMFDGSRFPLEENIAKTKEVVKVAHGVGVSVEGEIGAVRRRGSWRTGCYCPCSPKRVVYQS